MRKPEEERGGGGAGIKPFKNITIGRGLIFWVKHSRLWSREEKWGGKCVDGDFFVRAESYLHENNHQQTHTQNITRQIQTCIVRSQEKSIYESKLPLVLSPAFLPAIQIASVFPLNLFLTDRGTTRPISFCRRSRAFLMLIVRNTSVRHL